MLSTFSNKILLEALEPESVDRLRNNDSSLTQLDLSNSGISSTGRKIWPKHCNTTLSLLNLIWALTAPTNLQE
jgi:hypothetical protein